MTKLVTLPLKKQLRRGQSGLTLLEVIIYSVLSLALIGLAMGALGTVQKGVSNNSENSRMRSEGDEAILVMGRDLRNLGLKRLFYATAPDVFVDTLLTKASFTPSDSSSFLHRDGSLFDTLTFLRASLNNLGQPIGIDTVTYSVNPATRILSRTLRGAVSTTVCTRVEALQFDYGVSAKQVIRVNENPPVLSHWTASPAGDMAMPGVALELSKGTGGTVTAWQSTSGFATNSLRRYAFDLTGSGDASMMTNLDSLVVILCSASGTILASELISVGPATTNLHVEMGVPDCGSCYAGIRMKLHGSGTLSLSRFSFTEVSQGDLTWSSAPALGDKKAVRAVRVYLLVGSDKGMFGVHGNAMRLANASLSFNDRKGRSLLDEIVPTPNNGP